MIDIFIIIYLIILKYLFKINKILFSNFIHKKNNSINI